MELQILQFVLTLLIVVGGAIWTVGKIDKTTARLEETLKGVQEVVSELKNDLKVVHKTQTEHSIRIAVMEALKEKQDVSDSR